MRLARAAAKSTTTPQGLPRSLKHIGGNASLPRKIAGRLPLRGCASTGAARPCPNATFAVSRISPTPEKMCHRTKADSRVRSPQHSTRAGRTHSITVPTSTMCETGVPPSSPGRFATRQAIRATSNRGSGNQAIWRRSDELLMALPAINAHRPYSSQVQIPRTRPPPSRAGIPRRCVGLSIPGESRAGKIESCLRSHLADAGGPHDPLRSLLHRQPSRMIEPFVGDPCRNLTRILPVGVHDPDRRASSRLRAAENDLFPVR